MSQSAPPAILTRTPAAQLDNAELEAQQRIDEILAAAAAAGITGAALLALLQPITNAIEAAAQAGWGIGSRIVLNGAAGRRARASVLVVERMPTSVEQDVIAVIMDAAAKLDRAEAKQAEWERTKRRLRGTAVVKIHQATSAGTYTYARWLGLSLEWVIRRDGKACRVCRAMNGRRVGPGEKFAPPRGPGVPRNLWKGFRGLPPAHPNCRCKPVPRA